MALGRKPAETDVQPRLLEVDASMTGSLSFKDPVNLQINGRFEGALETKGTLTIGENAQVKATILGEQIAISGVVEGPITASRRLELLGTARVTGKVTTPKLVVHEGAVLQGACEMAQASGAEAPWVTPEELSRYLEVDVATILDWAKTGRLPAQQEQGQWRFDRARIDAWVAQEKIR